MYCLPRESGPRIRYARRDGKINSNMRNTDFGDWIPRCSRIRIEKVQKTVKRTKPDVKEGNKGGKRPRVREEKNGRWAFVKREITGLG